jgi:steroid 5-alpha reductase family enzyme
MQSRNVQSLIGIVASLLIASGVAWAASGRSSEAFGWPLFALCFALGFGIQWVAFIHSWLAQTEHFFDLTGGFTYLLVTFAALVLGPGLDLRSALLAALVAIWATRLSSFLFRRVRQDGSDGRFDDIKPDFLRLLMTWTLQGLWVSLTLSCALAAMTSVDRSPFGPLEALGLALWIAGFWIEVTADRQKRRFREEPSQDGRFIQSGLWAWSRHPNYFGEITLWLGIALIALPTLAGGQFVTLISPVFVYLLLTRISGVPMLEARGKKRWGDDAAYRAYLDRTPVLMMKPPRAQ